MKKTANALSWTYFFIHALAEIICFAVLYNNPELAFRITTIGLFLLSTLELYKTLL